MRLAVLRASGPNWDAKAFLQQHHLYTDAVWLAGDRYAGRLRAESGFNLTIADAASCSELVEQIGRDVELRRAETRGSTRRHEAKRRRTKAITL
jgi:hypothetical protein